MKTTIENRSGGLTPREKRSLAIEKLADERLDLLVIGGGIVGSGIARDAALRGLRTALIEQHDFAYGTSSRSSRLLHGGLRYLAQGRVGLVHEASVEKRVIHQIAPHLAAPLPFIFPTYAGGRDWVLWQLQIGVKIYDLLCGGRNLGKSTWLSRNAVLERVPSLSAEGLQGGVRYFDGFTNDARLTIDTLRSAARSGAVLLNYCRFVEAARGSLWECDLQDKLTGRQLRVKARAVVNATGPWAESVPHSRVKLRMTKGVHLVVERERVATPDTVVMTEGKRILFAIPWGERTILGTTDTDYSGRVEDVRVEPSDIEYILGVTNRHFPEARLEASDVLSGWAGLRPLIANPNGTPSDISRSHQIRSPEPGWWDVAGGKLTTYRLMAEQTVNRIIAWLRKQEANRTWRHCWTAHEPLLPAEAVQGVSSLVPPECERWVVEHYCAEEWAVHLGDVMKRRASWQYYLPESHRHAERVADWMGESLGWSEAEKKRELEQYFDGEGCQAGCACSFSKES